MTICPSCEGNKTARVFVQGNLIMAKCFDCNGTGEVEEAKAARIIAGKRMRDERVAAGLGLREAAKLRGISATELSKIERGEGS